MARCKLDAKYWYNLVWISRLLLPVIENKILIPWKITVRPHGMSRNNRPKSPPYRSARNLVGEARVLGELLRDSTARLAAVVVRRRAAAGRRRAARREGRRRGGERRRGEAPLDGQRRAARHADDRERADADQGGGVRRRSLFVVVLGPRLDRASSSVYKESGVVWNGGRFGAWCLA